MSDRYLITKDSVHELSRMSYILYKTFRSIDMQLVESKETLTSNSELDYSLKPENYYNFQFGLNRCYIVKLRSKLYSINCDGFTPSNVKPLQELLENYKLYSNLFGLFSDFGDCLNTFADIVHEMSQVKLKSLF